MTIEELKSKLTTENEVTFLIGNGINRYNAEKNNDWNTLISELLSKNNLDLSFVETAGISINEIYDIILRNKGEKEVNQTFIDLVNRLEPRNHHTHILNKITQIGGHILTTNFDETIIKSIDKESYSNEFIKYRYPFSHINPWNSYHSIFIKDDNVEEKQSKKEISRIYYIHGHNRYTSSIKLGLNQYVKNIRKATSILYGESGFLKNQSVGEDNEINRSWINSFFNRHLIIFGLGLSTHEFFLRWLIIKRYHYLFDNKKLFSGIFIYSDDENIDKELTGKLCFLKNFGIQSIKLSHEDIYENMWD